MKNKIRYQVRTIAIAAASDRVMEDIALDVQYQRITGIAVKPLVDSPMTQHANTKIGVKFNGNEVLPNTFPMPLLLTSEDVPYSERFLKVEELAGGRTMNVEIQDGGNAVAYPTYVTLVMRLENEPEKEN